MLLSVTSTSFIRLFIFLLVWAGRGAAGKKNRIPTREPPYITAGRRALGANDPGGRGGAELQAHGGERRRFPGYEPGGHACIRVFSATKQRKAAGRAYTWGAQGHRAGRVRPLGHRAAGPGLVTPTLSREARVTPCPLETGGGQ